MAGGRPRPRFSTRVLDTSCTVGGRDTARRPLDSSRPGVAAAPLAAATATQERCDPSEGVERRHSDHRAAAVALTLQRDPAPRPPVWRWGRLAPRASTDARAACLCSALYRSSTSRSLSTLCALSRRSTRSARASRTFMCVQPAYCSWFRT